MIEWYFRIRDWLDRVRELRMKSAALVAIVLLAIVGAVFAQQIAVMLVKASVVTCFSVLGYALYKVAFPLEPGDDERLLTICKLGMIVGTAIAGALAL